MSIWILVSDASRATLYAAEKRDHDWQVVDSYSHQESRLKDSELTPTEPGHSAKSKGSSRHTALEPTTSPHEAEAEHFAQQLADVLTAGTMLRSYDSVVLVAPPHFLGLLRRCLSNETQKRLLTAIDKDYTFADPHEARRRLEDTIFPADVLILMASSNAIGESILPPRGDGIGPRRLRCDMNRNPLEIFTIGHSTHTLERFLELLTAHGIAVLADIRRFPGSRKFPQFNQGNLALVLPTVGIEYRWFEVLGGRRRAATEQLSNNSGLRNASFRNYADYMLSQDFRDGIKQLLAVAAQKPTAIMCSESVFWRCHRRLVSDYLVVQGITVRHIMPSGDLRPHTLTSGAKVVNGKLSYPPPGAAPAQLSLDM